MSPSPGSLQVERAVLSNGLRLLVAPDSSIPLVAVAVVYDVGFRSEPKGRTGFAHLFEHLMFQGSAHVAKMAHARLVQGAGGVMNGHTRADMTSYFEALPAEGLELALWLEADRMGAVALNQENLKNQVDVVKEEIKVNVINRPYGGFPWISLPEVAFSTYPNAHNGYGDFAHLEQASLADAADFFRRYYPPANAVLAVTGNCTFDQVQELAERHFGVIPGRSAPRLGSFGEPLPKTTRRKTVNDPLAPMPAVAVGWRAPDPVADMQHFLAYSVLSSVLSDGDASRLRSRLVHRQQVAVDVACYAGTFGDGLTMRDPVLFQTVIYHPGVLSNDALIGVVEEELSHLGADGPTVDEMKRVAASEAADHWHEVDQVLNRALSLADLEVIHGRAELVGELPSLIARVTPEEVAAAASELLAQRPTILELAPGEPE